MGSGVSTNGMTTSTTPRWGPVYLVEMDQLPEPVLSEFKRGNFVVVKISAHKFSQVDPDQAMEWINGTGKKGCGIIGITKTTSALCRWTLPLT